MEKLPQQAAPRTQLGPQLKDIFPELEHMHLPEFDRKVIMYFFENYEMKYKVHPEVEDFIFKAYETNIMKAIDLVFNKYPPVFLRLIKAELGKEVYLELYNESKPKPKKKKTLRIIVIGMTRAGKTSLINCFYAWSKGWQQIEEFKDVLIATPYFRGTQGGEPQEIATNLGQSQTQKSQFFEFELKSGENIFNLIFMDTPGLGDTRGSEQDEKNLTDILSTVSKTPELNAIILMINGSDPAIKPPLLLAIEKVKGIIPNVVQDNVIVLLTNVSEQANLNLSHLDIQIDKSRIFTINNSIFSANPADRNLIALNNQNYQQTMKILGQVLSLAKTLHIKRTKSFTELKEKRDSYLNALALLKSELNQNLKQVDYDKCLQKDINEISKKQNLTDFQYGIPYFAEEETKYYTTRCVYCFDNCHKNCRLDETNHIGDNIFKRCVAFYKDDKFINSDGSQSCNQCSHNYKFHVHKRNIFVQKYEHYNFIKDVFQDYDQKKYEQEKDKKTFLKETLDKHIKLTNQKIAVIRSNIQKQIDSLQSICSNFNAKKQMHLTQQILMEQTEGDPNANPQTFAYIVQQRRIDTLLSN